MPPPEVDVCGGEIIDALVVALIIVMFNERFNLRFQVGRKDRSPQPSRVWNRIPDEVRQRIVDLALDVPELSPRELAVRFTDTESYFVSEASVYRLLKSLDLITSPAFIVVNATTRASTTSHPQTST